MFKFCLMSSPFCDILNFFLKAKHSRIRSWSRTVGTCFRRLATQKPRTPRDPLPNDPYSRTPWTTVGPDDLRPRRPPAPRSRPDVRSMQYSPVRDRLARDRLKRAANYHVYDVAIIIFSLAGRVRRRFGLSPALKTLTRGLTSEAKT